MARPRKPRQLKVLHGTFRGDRNHGNEPTAPKVAQIPSPPADLNEWGRAKWRELAPTLQASGLLTTLDLTSFEVLCREYGVYREAYQSIYFFARRGAGKPRPRTLRQYLRGRNSQTTPELAAYRDARNAYRVLMAEFGLGPASRNRIDLPERTKAPSRMQELVSGGA